MYKEAKKHFYTFISAWCHKLYCNWNVCFYYSYSNPVTIIETSTSFLEGWARTMSLDHRGTRSVFLVRASPVNMTNMSQNIIITWNISLFTKYSRTFQKIWSVTFCLTFTEKIQQILQWKRDSSGPARRLKGTRGWRRITAFIISHYEAKTQLIQQQQLNRSQKPPCIF